MHENLSVDQLRELNGLVFVDIVGAQGMEISKVSAGLLYKYQAAKKGSEEERTALTSFEYSLNRGGSSNARATCIIADVQSAKRCGFSMVFPKSFLETICKKPDEAGAMAKKPTLQ